MSLEWRPHLGVEWLGSDRAAFMFREDSGKRGSKAEPKGLALWMSSHPATAAAFSAALRRSFRLKPERDVLIVPHIWRRSSLSSTSIALPPGPTTLSVLGPSEFRGNPRITTGILILDHPLVRPRKMADANITPFKARYAIWRARQSRIPAPAPLRTKDFASNTPFW